MYSKSIQCGTAQAIRIESRREAYKPRSHHFGLVMTEEYIPESGDSYADGCSFAQSGGELWRLPVHLGIKGKGAIENRRLFRMGYNDTKGIKSNGKASL